MNYIENVFFCLAAPLIIALFCVHRFRRRSIAFIISGMAACLCSSYISTFLAKALGANALEASLEISPVIEEALKFFPLALYLLIYDIDERSEAAGEAIMVAVGFATLENACYLIANDAGDTAHLLIRGFSTGAMHVACGAITAIVLRVAWGTSYYRITATLGVLCLAITSHGIYNVLVNQEGAVAWVGYMLPLLLGAITIVILRKLYGTVAVLPKP